MEEVYPRRFKGENERGKPVRPEEISLPTALSQFPRDQFYRVVFLDPGLDFRFTITGNGKWDDDR